MRPDAIHKVIWLTLLASLVASGRMAHGEDPVETVQTDLLRAVHLLVAQPIPKRFCLHVDQALMGPTQSAAVGTRTGMTTTIRETPLFTGLDRTEGTLDRLVSARRLELLTILRSESAALFFGVNEHGRIGVHFDASQLMMPD